MATYYEPIDVIDGDFVSAEYWNRQFGADGSLSYLHEQYQEKTRGYHVKLVKSYTHSMTYSWVMDEDFSNVVNWDTATINYFPADGVSCWDIENPNYITIQESGFYNINVYLNMFNSTVPVVSVIYGHIIRQIEENNIITIATDHAYAPLPKTGNLTYPTFMNGLSEFVLSINAVYHLEVNDIIYVRLQPSVTISGDSATSFIGQNLTRVPTYYYSTANRGDEAYKNGIQSSFESSGYIGQTPSFFEIASIRLDN